MLNSMQCLLKLETILNNPIHTPVTSNIRSIKRDPKLRSEFCDVWHQLHTNKSRLWQTACELCHRLELKCSLHQTALCSIRGVLATSVTPTEASTPSETMRFTAKWMQMVTLMNKQCINNVCNQTYADIRSMETFLGRSDSLDASIMKVMLNEDVANARNALRRASFLGKNTSAYSRALNREKEAHFVLVKKLSNYFECYHPLPDCQVPTRNETFAKKLKHVLSMPNYRSLKEDDEDDDGCGIRELVNSTLPNIRFGILKGENVVIKSISHINCNPKQWNRFHREVTILQRARHDNIISLVDAFVAEDGMIGYVVTSRGEGDLLTVMKEYPQSFGENLNLLLSIVYGIARGLCHLHSLGILHLDIKPQNIVLKKTESTTDCPCWVPKIIDFDTSSSEEERREMVQSTVTVTRHIGVTAKYMAPELMATLLPSMRPDYGSYSDMYAFGKVLEEVVEVIKFRYPHCDLFQSLIQSLTQDDKTKRPTAFEVVDTIKGMEGFAIARRRGGGDGGCVGNPNGGVHHCNIMECPLYWDGSQSYQVVRMKPDDLVYHHIQRMINQGSIGDGGRDQKEICSKYNSLEVVSIERIENVAVWNLYVAKRNAMIIHKSNNSVSP
eukprot:PhF_6_TR29377/c3_g1_i1/m.43279